MNGGAGPLPRAFKRLGAGLELFIGLPFAVQLPGLGALALMLGTFAPWVAESDSFHFTSYYAGLDGIFGEVALLIGVVAIVLVAQLITRTPIDVGAS